MMCRVVADIIVPTYNRCMDLQVCLNSLVWKTQHCQHAAISVVDNGSTDGTGRLVQRFIDEHPGQAIRYIHEPVPGLLSGRHRGALEAKGELLVFIDDDIEATPEWLDAIVESFEDPEVHLVGGRNLPKYGVEPPRWLDRFWGTTPYGGKACGYLSLLDLGDEIMEIDPNYVWGLNFAIRRETLFELGGFHPDCIPSYLQHFQGDGETGLTMKAAAKGYKAIYQPRATVYHHVPAERMTCSYFERRAYYQGVCESYTLLRRKHLTGGSETVLKTALKSARRLAGKAKRGAVHLFGRLGADGPASSSARSMEDAEADKIQERVRKAYRAGFDFHQRAVRENPELLEWVLKPDYWDYRLPSIALRTNAGNPNVDRRVGRS